MSQMNVSFFATCLVDQVYPQAGLAAMDLLERLGVAVEFDLRQTCCGQPAFNSGYRQEACRVARSLLEVFCESERIVVPSGSCATMIKCYLPSLFSEGSPEWESAREIGARTFELSDFLVNILGITETGATFAEKVTFHDSCHQLRELGISQQPRTLIKHVKGIQFVELEDANRCCGFGGTFAVKFDEVSAAIGNDKVGRIRESGADYVVANDVSCLMHLDGLLKRQGIGVKTMHLAELLIK